MLWKSFIKYVHIFIVKIYTVLVLVLDNKLFCHLFESLVEKGFFNELHQEVTPLHMNRNAKLDAQDQIQCRRSMWPLNMFAYIVDKI